jgi:hypothetical protein
MARTYDLGKTGATTLLPRRQVSSINPTKAGLSAGIKAATTIGTVNPWAGLLVLVLVSKDM